MGNIISISSDGKKTVKAMQIVNIDVLGKMDKAHGKPGANIMHEVTEAYEGAVLSKKSGVEATPNSAIFKLAHELAAPQSGPIDQKLYDNNGMRVYLEDNPTEVNIIVTTVKDRQGKDVIIQYIH